MAATSLQDPNLVWQKVTQALATQAGTGSQAAADPASLNAFRALKLQMATQKRNQNLQFVPFGEADIDAATGYAGPTGTFTLYGIWAKKSGTGTTRAFVQVRNNNTVTGAGATGVLAEVGVFVNSGDEAVGIYPKGIAFTATTGTVILSATTAGGTGPSTGDGDSQHGFLVIGA